MSLEINKVMYTRHTLYARVLTLTGPTERDILPMRDYTMAPLTRAPRHSPLQVAHLSKMSDFLSLTSLQAAVTTLAKDVNN